MAEVAFFLGTLVGMVVGFLGASWIYHEIAEYNSGEDDTV